MNDKGDIFIVGIPNNHELMFELSLIVKLTMRISQLSRNIHRGKDYISFGLNNKDLYC